MIVDGNRTIASLNELSRLAADSMEASVALIAEDLAARVYHNKAFSGQ